LETSHLQYLRGQLQISLESSSQVQEFSDYFAYLNQDLPDYLKASQILTHTIMEYNTVNIKFPHTSWFSSVEYKEKVKELSQVAMSTNEKTVVLSSEIKLVLLGANDVSKPIHIDASEFDVLPFFLPTNYHNQNYYLNSYEMPNIQDSLHLIIKATIQFAILEPIEVVFKEIKTATGRYTNVHCFTHQKKSHIGVEASGEPDDYISGYIYTNLEGETKIVSWNGDYIHSYEEYEELFDASREKPFDEAQSLRLIEDVKSKVQESLPASLKKEFLDDLSGKLEAKRRTLQAKSEEELIAQENERSKALDKSAVQISDDSVKLTRKEVSHLRNKRLKRFAIGHANIEDVKSPKRLTDIHTTIEAQIRKEDDRAERGIENEKIRNRLQVLKQRVEEKQRSQRLSEQGRFEPIHAI